MLTLIIILCIFCAVSLALNLFYVLLALPEKARENELQQMDIVHLREMLERSKRLSAAHNNTISVQLYLQSEDQKLIAQLREKNLQLTKELNAKRK